MSKIQSTKLFSRGQLQLASRRFKQAYKTFSTALPLMEAELAIDDIDELNQLGERYESASFSAYSIFYAGRPKHQIEWLTKANSLAERSVELCACTIDRMEKSGVLDKKALLSQGLRLIRLSSECLKAQQFHLAEKYSLMALQNDTTTVRKLRHHLLRLEQRFSLHRILAEALAAQGHLKRALVVVDDGLALLKANSWYHHVDAVFLKRRSLEMEGYGKLCLLKADVLERLSQSQ